MCAVFLFFWIGIVSAVLVWHYILEAFLKEIENFVFFYFKLICFLFV